ncbi:MULTISPECIES: hypothetical protein [Chryseobacterium]|uniref:hypothetical protein n=1 Tax=Chryseobacterium sp. R2A-55 TaxID=2744445 RepID=UPI001F1B6670|nr:hypothetical protein [Chryseobacterium sp. R2A-55]
MFFIFGINRKPIGKENRKIYRNGFEVNAIIMIYRTYFEVFFIPLIPLGKRYSIYIPHSDEYFEQNYFSKIPEDLLKICRDAGRMY